MSVTEPAAPATSAAPTVHTATAAIPEPVTPAQETDWKAEARKWEERAKANKTAAEKLAEIEEATKTAEEKAAERLAAAERRAAELEVKALRAEIASTKGVPVALLTGSTQEELEAAADALIEFRGVIAPKPDLSQGGTGQTPHRTAPGADTFAAGVKL